MHWVHLARNSISFSVPKCGPKWLLRDYLSAQLGPACFPPDFAIQFFVRPHLRPQTLHLRRTQTVAAKKVAQTGEGGVIEKVKNAKNANILLISLQISPNLIRVVVISVSASCEYDFDAFEDKTMSRSTKIVLSSAIIVCKFRSFCQKSSVSQHINFETSENHVERNN